MIPAPTLSAVAAALQALAVGGQEVSQQGDLEEVLEVQAGAQGASGVREDSFLLMGCDLGRWWQANCVSVIDNNSQE